MGFRVVVTVSDGGHSDDGHPGHVGVSGAGRSAMDYVFCYPEAEGEHTERNKEDDGDEGKGMVLEDRFETKHDSRVGPIHLTNPPRTRRHVSTLHEHSSPEVGQSKAGEDCQKII